MCLSSATALAQDPDDVAKAPTGENLTLGLSPSAPQTTQLPGGVTPAFGQQAKDEKDWRFDFHGFMTVPLRAGINTRENPGPSQSSTVLHAPPLVPGPFGTFQYIGLVPNPWVQLNFSVGNPTVTATAIIAAKTVSDANSFFQPPDQMGINDAFLTFRVPLQGARLEWNAGAFTNRYGLMGEYDEGRYGTPVIGRLQGAGETLTAAMSLGSMTVLAEHGLLGQIDKAPLGVQPDGWNGFSDPNVGSSFAHHFHLGLGYASLVQLGVHYVTAWSQDDRAAAQLQPDGRVTVLGADARLTARRFGHLYLGFAYAQAKQARSVGNVLSVLNAQGGPGLRDQYLGPSVDGSLSTLAGQYDLSLGKLLRYPRPFNGEGPDVVFSLFGMLTRVASKDAAYDQVSKFKYGAEATYSMLRWLAVSGRYDRVAPNTKNDYQTFAVVSPRLIFRSDYNAQDQVVLQYSRWIDGSGVVVQKGFPPTDDPSLRPDENVISLSASMWW